MDIVNAAGTRRIGEGCTGHQVEIGFVGKKIATELAQNRAKCAGGKIVDKRQDGVKLDWKPAIGRRNKDAASCYPPEFPQECSLVSMGADILDHRTSVRVVVARIGERKIKGLRLDEAHAG